MTASVSPESGGQYPLNKEQIAKLNRSLRNPASTGWQAPPLTPGDWKDLPPDRGLLTLISIHDWFEAARPSIISDAWRQIDRVRTSRIACYPDGVMVEFQRSDEDGNCGLASALVHESGFLLMNGGGPQIHNYNQESEGRPELDSAGGRRSYLSFFMNWIHGDDGRYQVLYRPGDLQDRLLDPSAMSPDWPIRPPRQIRDTKLRSEGKYRYDVWVLVGRRLFRVEMLMRPQGLLEMTEDTMIADDLPVRPEWMDGPFLMSASMHGEATQS